MNFIVTNGIKRSIPFVYVISNSHSGSVESAPGKQIGKADKWNSREGKWQYGGGGSSFQALRTPPLHPHPKLPMFQNLIPHNLEKTHRRLRTNPLELELGVFECFQSRRGKAPGSEFQLSRGGGTDYLYLLRNMEPFLASSFLDLFAPLAICTKHCCTYLHLIKPVWRCIIADYS